MYLYLKEAFLKSTGNRHLDDNNGMPKSDNYAQIASEYWNNIYKDTQKENKMKKTLGAFFKSQILTEGVATEESTLSLDPLGAKTLRPIKNQNNIRVKSKSIAGRVIDSNSKQSPRNYNPSTDRDKSSISVFSRRKGSHIVASDNVSKRGIDDIIKDQDSAELIGLKVQTPRYQVQNKNRPLLQLHGQNFHKVQESIDRFTDTTDAHSMAIKPQARHFVRNLPQTPNNPQHKFFKTANSFNPAGAQTPFSPKN